MFLFVMGYNSLVSSGHGFFRGLQGPYYFDSLKMGILIILYIVFLFLFFLRLIICVSVISLIFFWGGGGAL